MEIVYEFIENGDLEIRKDGTIWRCKKSIGGAKHKKIDITPRRAEYKTSNGYLQIFVCRDSQCFIVSAHGLIWYHYTREIIDRHESLIHHKNENRIDNRFCNLELMTYSQHNRLHPRERWNYNKNKKNSIKFKEWHERTIISKNNNYRLRALETYRMVEIENLHPAYVAKILNVSKRTIYTHISDCIGRGWL